MMNSQEYIMYERMYSVMSEKFSTWLNDQLTERNWTQADLMRASGLPRGTISNILNNVRKPGSDVLQAIAHGLSIPTVTVYQAAGLLPPLEDDDQWVEKQTHRLSQISDPTLREIANNFILSIVGQEDAKQKKQKLKPQTVSKDK